MTSRVSGWLLSICTLLALAWYLVWTLLSESPSALNAELHPLKVLREISYQLGQAGPPEDWNIPFKSISVWITWLISIVGCGTLATRFLTPSAEITASARSAIQFAVGFVIYAMLQLLLGVIGLARFPLILPLFGLAVLISFGREYRQLLLATPRAVQWQWKHIATPGKAVTVVLLSLAAMLLVPALTPPIQSDAVRYHLGAVQEYLKSGHIGLIPLNAYSNMPFLVEMHFLGALACGAPEASQLMHLTLAVFTCLAIYALVLQLAPVRPPTGSSRLIYLLPSALYIGTPMSGALATWPFTDHGISFFLVVSVLSALTCVGKLSNTRGWVLLGTIAGGLIGTKYTMGPVAVAIIMLPWLRARSREKSAFGSTAAGFLVMGIIGGTWYLKNFLLTGNPFYPLAGRCFPGGQWTAVNDAFLFARAGAKGMGTGLFELVKVPVNATFHWIRFESHHPGATLLIATTGAIIGLWPTSIRSLNRDRQLIFGVTILTFVIWFFSYQSNRLLLPTLALALCLTPIHLLADSATARRMYSTAATVAAACGLAWAVQWSWVATALSPPPLPYLLGAQDSRSYRYSSLTYARAFDYLNQHVKPGEKVLLVGEHRIYGASFEAIWSDWFDTPALVYLLRKHQLNTTEQLLDYLRANNIRWILINGQELRPQLERDFRPWFTPSEWAIFQDLRTLKRPGVRHSSFHPG